MSDTLRVVVKEPGSGARVEVLPRATEAAFAALIGECVEVLTIGPGVVMVMSEEALRSNLPKNFTLVSGTTGVLPIVGPVFFVCVDDNGDFVDVNAQVEARIGAGWSPRGDVLLCLL